MEAVNLDQLCPVCGAELWFEPWNGDSPSDEICPCCGIQFGYDDAAGGQSDARKEIYQTWRNAWVHKGMTWNSAGIKIPRNWDPVRQLKKVSN